MSGARVCPSAVLEDFTTAAIAAMGADEDVAIEVARHLVRANLSGHDSHGVLRLPQYVAQMDRGDLIPAARPKFVTETPVTALIDAQYGFGHFSTAFAIDWAIGRAMRQGLAAASIRHSTHIGRLGEYVERAAGHGLVATVTVGAAGPGIGGMALFGSNRRFFGANPWAIGIPAEGRPPVVYDGSTSTIAEGKVRLARAKGSKLPHGCIVDAEGNASDDPEDFYAGGALVPLGGEVAGHKGYGLALASALIGGLAMIDDERPSLAGTSVFDPTQESRGRIGGVFVSLLNPGWFGDPERYAVMVRDTVEAAKRMPPAAGRDEIRVPGEPESRCREARAVAGIALPASTIDDLLEVARRFGVTPPREFAE